MSGWAHSSSIVADFNQDTISDLAVAETNSSTVGVLLGNGDGTFQGDVANPVGLPSASIAAGDLNGDTMPDIVAGSYSPGLLRTVLHDLQYRRSHLGANHSRFSNTAADNGRGERRSFAGDGRG